MAMNLSKVVLDFLKDRTGQKFSAREIADWVFATFPDECQTKKQNSLNLNTDTDLLQQLAGEISARRPRIQKRKRTRSSLD